VEVVSEHRPDWAQLEFREEVHTMSDQGLSIFDEPEDAPEGDEQPTQVMKAQDDPGEESASSAKSTAPAKKATTKSARTKVPAVGPEDPTAAVEDEEPVDDPQPTQQLETS
jgi:hypothetical protein